MKTKLILIEGIPGSGKTTLAKKTAEWLRERGNGVHLYAEGQSHPADLGWNACIPVSEYRELLRRYAPLSEEIERNTVLEDDMAIVAYTQIMTEDRGFYNAMEAREVYDGRVADDVFFGLHYRRWQSFAQRASSEDGMSIFECAFLQNHVNELLFWRDADEETIIGHHIRLMESVKTLSPILIYLSQPDIRATIERIARERVSPENGNWIDRCIAYCESSPYGRKRGLKGFEGIMEFFSVRKRMEMDIIKRLSIPCVIIDNPHCDWDDVFSRITAQLSLIG